MSFTDPQADVQPDEGQGEGGTPDAPYAEYLDRIPEQFRGTVEPVFKEWDGNVTKRFQEASEFRKQWEPLQETGVDQLSADEVAWLVQFRGALNDPQTMQQWWDGYAQENGLTPQQAQQEQTLDEFGSFQDPQQLQSLIDQATGPLKQQLEQMQGHIEQQQQQQQLADANQYVEGQVAELEKKHGVKFVDGEPERPGEASRELLAVFAGKFADSDPMNAVTRGYEAMTKFVNGIERQSLQAKVGNPSPAEGGGVPDTSPEQFKTVNDPGLQEAAKQWMRNNR